MNLEVFKVCFCPGRKLLLEEFAQFIYLYVEKTGGGSLTNKDLTMHRKSVKNMQIQMRNNLH